MLTISIPSSKNSLKLEIDGSLVIIGSNGSGKSRLGSYIENNVINGNVKRISAQRMLNLPENAPILSLVQSYQNLKNNWFNRHVIDVQNDYESLISTLFAKTRKRNDDYIDDCKKNNSGNQLPLPISDSEKLINIWDKLFPHIKLDLSDGKVLVIDKNGNKYPGREMSDGERVAFYLIAQCLVIPEEHVIIIDEPELHLHKSLMNRLWNQIEIERSDCDFIFITHDLDFASGRTNAKKIWVKSYFENKWEWDEVPNIESIPENLLLEIIGSRKPILFVEGEKDSLDYRIYQHIYTSFTIIPRGGAKEVIQSTKGINKNKELHLNRAFGLIDRDQRSENEIELLEKDNIYTIELAEIENFLASPIVTKLISNHLEIEYGDIEYKIQEFITKDLLNNFEKVVSNRTSTEVSYILNTLNQKAIGKEAIKNAMEDLTKSVAVDDIFDRNVKLYSELIESKDIIKILKHYTNKGIVANISIYFNQNSKGYTDLAINLLKKKSKEIIPELGLCLSEKLLQINSTI